MVVTIRFEQSVLITSGVNVYCTCREYVQPGHDVLIHSISDSHFQASVQPRARGVRGSRSSTSTSTSTSTTRLYSY